MKLSGEPAEALTEFERLTAELEQTVIEKLSDRIEKAEAERDSFQSLFRSCLKGNNTLREKLQKTSAERDEARAQVAAALAEMEKLK